MDGYIDPTAIIDDGATLEDGVVVWHHAHIRSTAVLERKVSIGQGVYVDEDVRISEGARIQNGVSVYKGVEIGRWCFVGPAVVFTNDPLPRAWNQSWTPTSTTLETGCAIGAGAVIVCGVTIGAFALVAAGAILTHDVPAFHLAIGTPARPTRMICACGQTALPLGASKTELIRDCCLENMLPEMLDAARKWLSRSTLA